MKKKSAGDSLLGLLLALGAVVTALGLWQLAVSLSGLSEFILPAPGSVLRALVDDLPLLGPHLGSTILHTLAFFLLSLAFSLVLGLILAEFPWVERFLRPLLVFTQTVPPLILYPLLLIWLDYGTPARIVLGFLACFFTILVNFLQGLKAAEPGFVDLYRSLGAGRVQILLQVRFPSALPSLFAGLKIAGAWALMAAVMSEFIGAPDGLGVYLARAFKSFATVRVFAAVLVVSLLSVLFYQGLVLLEKIFVKGKKESES